jgi:hypothetical protein
MFVVCSCQWSPLTPFRMAGATRGLVEGRRGIVDLPPASIFGYYSPDLDV